MNAMEQKNQCCHRHIDGYPIPFTFASNVNQIHYVDGIAIKPDGFFADAVVVVGEKSMC